MISFLVKRLTYLDFCHEHDFCVLVLRTARSGGSVMRKAKGAPVQVQVTKHNSQTDTLHVFKQSWQTSLHESSTISRTFTVHVWSRRFCPSTILSFYRPAFFLGGNLDGHAWRRSPRL